MERTLKNQVCTTNVRLEERKTKRKNFLILVIGIYF